MDGEEEVAGAVIIEWTVEDYFVPPVREVQFTMVDGGELINGDEGCGIGELVKSGVGHVDGAVGFEDMLCVVVVDRDGVDVQGGFEFGGEEDLL